MKQITLALILVLALSCSDGEEKLGPAEVLSWEQFAAPVAERMEREPYLWERDYVGDHPRITKEYFQCGGSSVSPMRTISREEEEVQYLHDCGGCKRHGLPLLDGEEAIYPILIDLLNAVQEKTGKRVVVTCGHRCPDHNAYSDPSKFNEHSKHMVGAEVDFYVQGMEEAPEEVIALLIDQYANASEASYREFKRYTKENTDVSTPPWYNKEVFIKLYKETEGRDFDNRHPYPYVGIQVRYDGERSQWVAYTWKAAHYNYRRE